MLYFCLLTSLCTEYSSILIVYCRIGYQIWQLSVR